MGIFLARTVPSGDGGELRNALALADAGPKAFNEAPAGTHARGNCRAIPRSEGKFPAQPGRRGADRRRGFKRSQKFLAAHDLASVVDTRTGDPAHGAGGVERGPPTSPAQACEASSPAPAARSCGRCRTPETDSAYLYNGPQLGFSIPELFVEFELHTPELPNIHGVSAPGVPGDGHRP